MVLAKGGEQNSGGQAAIDLGRFRLYPEQRLPDLGSGLNPAVRADLAGAPSQHFMALVCDPRSQPRLDLMTTASKIESRHLMAPLDWGVVDWPDGRRRFAAVFEHPGGGRLLPGLGQSFPPVGEDEVVRNILTPLVIALRELHEAGIVHGSINPLTIVFRDADRRDAMLGEYLTTAAGSTQPAFFAPVETALAAPMARGEGQFSDDVFALGATAAFLLLGGHPGAAPGAGEETLLDARIEQGSYAAIAGEERIPLGMIEVMRGMLSDNLRGRWTLAEVEDWLPSRRVTGRSALSPRRAARPFEFEGRSFSSGRALARAFSRKVGAAAEAIREPEFERWVLRALGDEAAAVLVKKIKDDPPVGGPPDQQDEALVSRAAMALDRQAPIRFRGLSAALDGLPGLLARFAIESAPVDPAVEILTLGLPQFALTMHAPLPPEQLKLLQLYERARAMLTDRRLGGGFERALYELNPNLHCLSPIIERDCVLTIGHLLPALDKAAASGFGGSFPVDRHIVAFVAARFRAGTKEWGEVLSSRSEATRLLGALRFFGEIEKHSGARAHPGLARWFAERAKAVIERYHHRPTRRHLEGLLERTAAGGRLTDLLRVLDNPGLLERDRQSFAEASRNFLAARRELDRIAGQAAHREAEAGELGGQMAASAATVLAGIVATAAIILLG